MPGLSDIARSFRTVKVSGVDIDVTGVSAEGIAFLFSRFPVIKELVTGKQPDLSADLLMKLGPDAVACIITIGTSGGVENFEANVKVARTLGIETQFDLLDAILKETMPGGVGPFADRLTAMFSGLGVEFTNTADIQSQSQSNPSLPADTKAEPSGG